jgi:hypothetical protein
VDVAFNDFHCFWSAFRNATDCLLQTILSDNDFRNDYQCYYNTIIFSGDMEEKAEVLYVRAIPVWHIIIFAMLCFIVLVGSYGVLRGRSPPFSAILFFYIIFGSLLSMFLYSIIFSKIKVYEDGIRFRLFHAHFEDMRLKWSGRLVGFGGQSWFILLNPKGFVEAIKGRVRQ